MKKLVALLVLLSIILASCSPAADVASYNISKDADNFKVNRRITVINCFTDTHLFTVEGKCSLGNSDVEGELSLTCKTGEGTYAKHFIGLADNVTYVVEQIADSPVSPYHYKLIFNPAIVIPDIELVP